MKNTRKKSLLKSVTPHGKISRKLGGPSALDWRQKNKVTPVKDQGFCGDCWAFATAAYCQSSLIINKGYNTSIDLSEQYFLECTPESDCQGGYPAYALLVAITFGVPLESSYPYQPDSQNDGICEAKGLQIPGKQVYVFFSLSDLELIYLLQTSPVVVGVASQDWELYKSGIMRCQPNATEDHSVLLVGYTPQYWIVKNSWGQNWGENGYIRISRNKGANCLMGVEVEALNAVPLLISLMSFFMIFLVGY